MAATSDLAAGSALAWSRMLVALGDVAGGLPPGAGAMTGAEWDDFALVCEQNWVAPLLWSRWQRNGLLEDVPDTVAGEFEERYTFYSSFMRKLREVVLPLLPALRDEGIDVLVLKGLHLAEDLYDDPMARPMVDVDLLVRPGDGRAVDIVEVHGFRQDPMGSVLDPVPWQRVLSSRDQLAPFYHPDGPPIELHYALEAPDLLPSIDMAHVWERSERLWLGGADVRVLATSDLLVHLCVHAAFHHVFDVRALSLADIAELIVRRRADIDWSQFWRTAEEWRVERSCILALALVHYRLECPVPDAVRERLPAAEEVQLYLDAAEARMRSHSVMLWRRGWPPAVRNQRRGLDGVVSMRRMAPRRQVRFVLERLFPPRREVAEAMGAKAAGPWIIALYPARWLTLMMTNGPSITRQARLWALRWRRGSRAGGGNVMDDQARLLVWLAGDGS